MGVWSKVWSSKKKTAQKLSLLGCFLLVEAMGVEPMSEKNSA